MFNRAKDSWEKLWWKKLVRRVALSTLLPFFVSCSWWWDTKSWGSDDPGVTVLPEKIESTVQMFGNLSNANVVLKTLDGVVLYETTTDENGKYVIDPVLFNQKLASNFLTGESNIVIEAYSWRDEEFDMDMNWVINAVIKAKNIDGSFVSYYSDFVYNILFGEYGSNLEIFKNENWEICPDLIRKKIDQIITWLWTDDIWEDWMLMWLKMNDINWDWKVDRDDLNIYDVIENRNFWLKTLQYRQSLYSWNDVGKAIFLNAERNRLNFVSLVNQKVESWAFSMNLVWSDYYWQVEYSYDWENWIPANELTLNIWETIQYREQYRDNLWYSSIWEFSLTQELYNDLEINWPINELCETWNDNSWWDTDSWSSGEDDNTDTWWEDNWWVDDTQIVISDITTWTITDSQTQEVNDNLVIDSNPSSETQDLTEIVIWVDQAEVDRINWELTTLKADITKKEEELEANKTSLTNLKTWLSNLQSWAIWTYNDSEYSSKVLVDTSLSGWQKKIELEGNLDWKYQYAYTVYEKDSYEGKVFLSSIWSTTITQWTQVTNEMIAELEQKIATEEKDLLQKQKELKDIFENGRTWI